MFRKGEMKPGVIALWVGGILLALWFLNANGFLGATTAPTTTTSQSGDTVPAQCSLAPTVSLSANDKYESGQGNWGTWRYKLNGGGGTDTDADGSFEVGIDSALEVLVADGNSSTFYRSIWKPSIVRCGINPDTYNEVIKATTYSGRCYNEQGDVMNGTDYGTGTQGINLSIGTEGTRNVKCELDGVAKTGVPHGAVMIVEFNQSTYKEADLSVQWNGATATPITTPSAYTVGTAGATTRSFDIPAFEGPNTIPFHLNNLQADTGIDPQGYNEGTVYSYTSIDNNVLVSLYPKNCYEEEDVTPSEFKCGIQDMDNTFTSPYGTAKATAPVLFLAIPVS